MKFQSSRAVRFTMQYMKKVEKNQQNVKNVLSDTYFCPKSIKTVIRANKKWLKRNSQFNEIAMPSEVKSLAYPVSLC